MKKEKITHTAYIDMIWWYVCVYDISIKQIQTKNKNNNNKSTWKNNIQVYATAHIHNHKQTLIDMYNT